MNTPKPYYDLDHRVRLVTNVGGYPARVPYGPAVDYPEFTDCDWARKTSEENQAYDAVRRVLQGMGLDREHARTPQWNPLRELVPPGGRVTIKPNMVRHWNEDKNDCWQTVVTHWAVVRPLVDYALLAVGPGGCVTVGDASHWDCDMDVLERLIGVPTFREHYDRTARGQVAFIDFRPEYFVASGVSKCEPRPLAGDPAGYTLVDLADQSMFADPSLDPRLFYGVGYDNRATMHAHSGGRHQYRIAGSALDCDLFINVPKLKTHHLLGITAAMKNLVGINGDKNYLPHFRIGFSDQGGDQYPRRTASLVLRYWINRHAMPILARSYFLTKIWGRLLAAVHAIGGKNPYAGGGWIGNDTVWRMTLDLNRILLYARKDGSIDGSRRARHYLSLVDGIVAGEGQGPMNVQARPAGILLAAGNPLLSDWVASRVMGFDPMNLKLIPGGLREHPLPIARVQNVDEIDLATFAMDQAAEWKTTSWTELPDYHFRPPTGWEKLISTQGSQPAERKTCHG